jgi:hypothetical protein
MLQRLAVRASALHPLGNACEVVEAVRSELG